MPNPKYAGARPLSVRHANLYNARRQHPQAEERFNARHCDLDTLLQEADFVRLILPLSEETHHLFGQGAVCQNEIFRHLH